MPKRSESQTKSEVREALRTAVIAGEETRAEAALRDADAALRLFHPITAKWFRTALGEPTAPQREGWPAIARGESTLILAPTGTGKTLTAFLWCLDRLMFGRNVSDASTLATHSSRREHAMNGAPQHPFHDTQPKQGARGCRVLYLSPLKALAADVEKNLQRPLEGIEAMAREAGVEARLPQVTMRTGDTPAKERARFLRHPGEILITTPESLYLMLTSQAGERLRTVETVIIDEIHAMVPTKRGAHLALSLERLEALVRASGGSPLQRIGLSATQRPLEEVASFLGGTEVSVVRSPSSEARALLVASSQLSEEAVDVIEHAEARYRPVTVVNAGARKQLELRVEVPVEDMARLSERAADDKDTGPKRNTIWASIYPRLLEIVRERRSTLIFVNARRIAERMAGAINELAGEPIARAHHGSLAAAQRKEIEDLLKAGEIKVLVATSSLELGIDMGAIDLVIQVEAPPSVASGMQRIGRAGHQVGAASHGILIPKYRSDLVACAAVTQAMHEGHVESTRFLRNPLDVLAQQIVATVAHPPMSVAEAEQNARRGEEDAGPGIASEALYALLRGAAPFAGLSRATFFGVLDMLSGLYPSDEFGDLRARVTWDRKRGWLTPRTGVKRIAIMNGGTIPDRGLYGVFLAGERSGSGKAPVRVGELDEEMVFETKPGEVFLLGASAWRIEEITQDRVLVSPAPGEAGKMPFWHGDRAGRPMEFGRRIGALVRELRAVPQTVAIAALVKQHDLDANAAENLLQYLADQEAAANVVPDDATVLIERVRDEIGFWRVCVLTPFGSRIHAPWAMAAAAKVAAAGGPDVETMWGEDGFVLRFPDTEAAPDVAPLLPSAAEASELVTAQVGSTSLFAAKFREAASRALLLPRRRMDGRTPLWQQRKRAYDLLSVASRFAGFPILLEAYRECLRDVFDMPALAEVLRGIEAGTLSVRVVDSEKPSPFAAALLFSYVANYIYDGDAPLAERRAQALAIDQDQLRELMGDADLRELLDARAIEETEEQLQALAEGYRARGVDGVHDLLLRIGDLSQKELQKRVEGDGAEAFGARLVREKRAVWVKIASERWLIAAEDAGRYRDALGVKLPKGLPEAFLARAPEAAMDLLRRFARTHGPFTAAECAGRFGIEVVRVEALLEGLVASGRVAEGGFRPGGVHREWCDVEVLRAIRRKSLARLRREVEPVDPRVLARLVTRWQGVVQPRRGLDALLDAIEGLQGAAVPASILETEILPARISGYKAGDLDTLIAAGEVAWAGKEPLGERDGRVGLYLAERLGSLWLPKGTGNRDQGTEAGEEREEKIVALLRERGASFFQQVHEGVGGGFPGETLDALWRLAWQGLVLNDTMHALRAYTARPEKTGKRAHLQGASAQSGFRSRRTTPPAAQGRWSLNAAAFMERDSAAVTHWSHAMAQQLLTRYGVVFRETAHAEGLPGGFSAVYDVLKVMEESGKVRRGYFVAELGATQFALPAAVELLRTLRSERASAGREMVMLAATDPANPYGALLKWPEADLTTSLTRSVGAKVILCDGCLAMYLRRGNPNVQVFLPEEEPERSQVARALAEFLVGRVRAERDESGGSGTALRAGLVIATVNGVRVGESAMAQPLLEAGFAVGAMGFYVRRIVSAPQPV